MWLHMLPHFQLTRCLTVTLNRETSKVQTTMRACFRVSMQANIRIQMWAIEKLKQRATNSIQVESKDSAHTKQIGRVEGLTTFQTPKEATIKCRALTTSTANGSPISTKSFHTRYTNGGTWCMKLLREWKNRTLGCVYDMDWSERGSEK